MPTTAPTPIPTGNTWHAAATEAPGADGSAAKPFNQAHAQARVKSGDTLLYNGGDTFAGWMLPKGIANVTIGSYGTGRAIIDAPTAILFLQASGTTEIRDLILIDSTRNPFSPHWTNAHQGGFGVSFRDCQLDKVWVHGCLIQWQAVGIDTESNGEHDTLIENNVIGPVYGINQRSQGIYGAGQVGGIIRGNVFSYCGWYPGIAPADNNQNHGIYWHWDSANPGGPVQILNNQFFNCCSAGPTSNTGGICDGNLIVNCCQDGSGIAAWLSSDSAQFTRNTVVGGCYNAISKRATITDNQFVTPGSLAVNVDMPAGAVNWRAPTDVVDVQRNVALGFVGPVIRIVNNGGGRVNDPGNNTALPTAGILAASLIQLCPPAH